MNGAKGCKQVAINLSVGGVCRTIILGYNQASINNILPSNYSLHYTAVLVIYETDID